ncbi:MAG: transposase, partial [Candidatus Thiodiazotropha endolucinida]|nr:transposase [Candidatus Thiodiazotropha taylori]MCW4351512.1 transposase [Candidatus Thiodiazotropha endolucinida]
MPNYRRILMPGGTYFFTVVTYNRRPMLIDEMAREVLREAISLVRNNQPFKIDAFCLLPDHIHTIWTLPEGDFNYSQRWRAIKGNFSRRYREQVEGFLVSNRSRQT